MLGIECVQSRRRKRGYGRPTVAVRGPHNGRPSLGAVGGNAGIGSKSENHGGSAGPGITNRTWIAGRIDLKFDQWRKYRDIVKLLIPVGGRGKERFGHWCGKVLLVV